jgi:type I restriction enzyme S subunit
MMDGLQPYPEYRDSGVPWLGDIPAHWNCFNLRRLAHIQLSNVDKHSFEGEIPVWLCNYSDVYNREFITPDLKFMRATASPKEIAKFTLRKGDVLITKDSESWEDIAVPGYVVDDLPNVLCGYHLAQIRSREQLLDGAFLFRAFQAETIAYQFRIAAKGVTRYGLSNSDIASAIFPIPPLKEQAAIVRLLNHADHRISRYIRAKRKLIALLNEQKQIIIQNAVTRGLDPNVPMKDSGVEWLGEIPAHWESARLKRLFEEIDDRTKTGEETLLSLRMYQGLVPHTDVSTKPITSEQLIGYKRTYPGEVVMNRMRAAIGLFGITTMPGLVSPDYAIFRKIANISPEYYVFLFKTPLMKSVFRRESKGLGTGSSGFLRLYSDQFGLIEVPLPSHDEQLAIVSYITNATREFDDAIKTVEQSIVQANEYRTRLIADVVTGKLDVRKAARHLPDEDDQPDEPDDDDLLAGDEDFGELEGEIDED